MPPANDPGAGSARAPVDRQLLDAARHRVGSPSGESAGHWTACTAPGKVLVVDPDGALRACEFGAEPLGDAKSGLDDLLERAERELGSALADAQLPLPHCRGCAVWCSADLHAAAPLVRDHGKRNPAAHDSERIAVVRLDAAGTNPRFAEPTFTANLAAFPEVVFDGADTLAASVLAACVAAWRQLAEPPRVTLRMRRLAELDRAVATLDGSRVGRLELVLTRADEPAIAMLAALADRLGAPASVGFTLTPDGWFDFEQTIDVAARHGATVQLRILDRNGVVPLDGLSVEQASLVRDAILERWNRLHGAERPASLADGDFDRLCQELRALVGRAVEAAHHQAEPIAPLALPPLDHPWHDGQAAETWHRRLFWRAHTPLVQEWLLTVATPRQLAQRPWLRALAHRIAFQTQTGDLLHALRDTYATRQLQTALDAEDRRFAAAFDLRRFGGPWADRIGLGPPRQRRKPFAIGAASSVATDAVPEVTVLIPSYRHAQFVKQTIQSVLAQRDVPFQVLVADDRSPDRTVAIARAIGDPRVTVQVNDTNLGLGNSVLAALAQVDTEFVALLNSDDLLHPEHLAVCRDVLRNDPQAMLVCTDIQPVDARGGRLDVDNVSLVHDGKQVFEWIRWFARTSPATDVPAERSFGELLERNYLITSSNLFVRTEWLRRQAGSLRSLKYCLDWRLFLQAAAEGALRHVRRPLIAYRLHGSNTVWFDAERRYTYYLEVNRVVAEALHHFAECHPDPDAAIEQVLDAVAHHVSRNGEVDGYALFLNAAVDALQLEHLAVASPRARTLLLELSTAADRRRTGAQPPNDHEAQMLALELEHLRGLLSAERGQRRWLQVASDRQAENLAKTEATSRRIWAEKEQLRELTEERARRLRALQEQFAVQEQSCREHLQQLQVDATRNRELAEQRERLRAQLAAEQQLHAASDARSRTLTEQVAALDAQLAQAVRERATLDARLATASADLTILEGQLATAKTALQTTRELATAASAALARERQQRAILEAELADTATELAARASDLAATAAELATTAAEKLATAAQLSDTRAELATTTDTLRRAEHRIVVLDGATAELGTRLQRTRDQLLKVRDTQRQTRAELDRTHASREYRLGDFLWNRLPLASTSRRLKKWYRKLLDAQTRWRLGRKPGRGAQTRIVATSTSAWPVNSHTFVHQEQLGLVEAGFDVRIFHWDREPGQLHAAFASLLPRRVQLQSVWSNHERDRAWFERTRPERFASFLAKVAAHTGKSVAAIRDDGIVQRACTFARLVELSRARYLHSYFFYDMSFMAMLAAWLLELPRGITCYADHMLDDHPWKLVPLHLELCDLVVATSERIARELSTLGRGRIDDKIVVKPNGVDGRRFPALEHRERPPNGKFEVLSLCRIEPKKGLLHLVDAVATLVGDGVPIAVHVVGGEDPHSPGSVEYAAEFRQRIAQRGLGDQFVLHGPLRQEQLPPLLQRCHAFVAPYVETENGDKDGIPTAVLEAMASALPIVATTSGSIPEAVTPAEGLLVAPGDAQALAAALRELHDSAQLADRLGRAARQRFTTHFDTAVTERRLHERIQQLLAARG